MNEWFVESIGYSSSFQREWQERKSRIERASSKCKITLKDVKHIFVTFVERRGVVLSRSCPSNFRSIILRPKPPPIHFSVRGFYGSQHRTLVS